MLSIETHENQSTDGGHKICLGNNTWMDLNDPDLIKSFETLKNKGVKIGVLDNSCYGGETVKLLSPYGCVVSTQSASQESIANQLFFSKDPDTLKSGVNTFARQLLDQSDEISPSLEDVFIKTSLELDSWANFPQMSGTDPLVNQSGEDMANWMFAQMDLVSIQNSTMGRSQGRSGNLNQCNPNFDYGLSQNLIQLEQNLKKNKWLGFKTRRDRSTECFNQYLKIKSKVKPLLDEKNKLENEIKKQITIIRNELEKDLVRMDPNQHIKMKPGSEKFWSIENFLRTRQPIVQQIRQIPYIEDTDHRPANRRPSGLDDRGSEVINAELANRWVKIEKSGLLKKLEKLDQQLSKNLDQVIPLQEQAQKLLLKVSTELNNKRITQYLSRPQNQSIQSCQNFKLKSDEAQN